MIEVFQQGPRNGIFPVSAFATPQRTEISPFRAFAGYRGLSRRSYSSGMVKVTEIGSLEGRMCGHLAASLCVFFAGPDGAGQKGGFVARTCPSDWVAAEQALLDVGLMHAAITPGRGPCSR